MAGTQNIITQIVKNINAYLSIVFIVQTPIEMSFLFCWELKQKKRRKNKNITQTATKLTEATGMMCSSCLHL